MKILCALILYLLFFILCFLGTGSDEKNIKSYYSYPDIIQDEIRKSGRFQIPKKHSYALTFLSNTLVFTAVFVLIGILIHEKNFWYFLLLGEGLNLFDLLVVDLIWWQHSQKVRLTGIGNPEDYLGTEKHVKTFLRAVPVFAIAAFLTTEFLNLVM